MIIFCSKINYLFIDLKQAWSLKMLPYLAVAYPGFRHRGSEKMFMWLCKEIISVKCTVSDTIVLSSLIKSWQYVMGDFVFVFHCWLKRSNIFFRYINLFAYCFSLKRQIVRTCDLQNTCMILTRHNVIITQIEAR